MEKSFPLTFIFFKMVKTTNQIDTNTIQKWWKQENRTWDSHWSAGDPHFDESMISYDFDTLYTLAACLSFRTRGFLELNTKHPVMVYLSIPWWKMSNIICPSLCPHVSPVPHSQHITACPIDGPVSLGPQKPGRIFRGLGLPSPARAHLHGHWPCGPQWGGGDGCSGAAVRSAHCSEEIPYIMVINEFFNGYS